VNGQSRHYIGVKIVEAWPQSKAGEEGYAVRYPDGYTSWSPKETFEFSYFPMGIDNDPSMITQDMVDRFLGPVYAWKYDEKTTMVEAPTLTGYAQRDWSASVDPANFNMEIGKRIATDKIKDRIWGYLGFVLRWARYGLKVNPPRQFKLPQPVAYPEPEEHVEASA
jgi:hypothetical protein